MNARHFLPALRALALALPLHAQKMQNAAGEAPGPWLLGTIGVGQGADAKTPQTTALKGLAIKVGEHGEAAVAYDLDLCRMVGAWTGGEFVTPMNLMSRGEYPTALGEVLFTTGEVPGLQRSVESQGGIAQGELSMLRAEAAALEKKLATERSPSLEAELASLGKIIAAWTGAGLWKDPRPEPFGPLPSGQARFKGFYVNGDKTILKWDIAGTEMLEMPQYAEDGKDVAMVRRSFQISAAANPMTIVVCAVPSQGVTELMIHKAPPGKTRASASFLQGDLRHVIVADASTPPGSKLEIADGQIRLVVAPHDQPAGFTVGISRTSSRAQEVMESGAVNYAGFDRPAELLSFIEGAPARWPEAVSTTGDHSPITDHQSPSSAAYVIDTIKLPEPNPWSAPMFTSGFDFFEDGRAAVCTFHGDVFVVSGIDEKLEKVTWRRFASGLYHPLGLKVVKGEIYVTCRDGIWRLKDLNADGECDFYEAFNFDLKVTKSFHEFVFDLQTDPAGNFYFAKAGPVKNGGRGFDGIMSQHGTLMRVSPDGAKLDVIATGFRAPNGIGVGPHGELTSGDNEGTWTPACKINWIKPGGFYGCVPLAHGFGGIKGEADLATLNLQRSTLPYDPPLCWLPKRIDNSGGSQVWVPEGDRWGPWGGQMLHLSYGQSSLYGVLMEEVAAAEFPKASTLNSQPSTLRQGGVVKFPLQFQSGIMRARFNPKDGQLYVMGLRGWQTNGLKNGCFQRVRFTGAVPRMPVEMHVRKDGIELRFACTLDTQTARDPQNWSLEKWRYLWSAAYGSPELSTEEPEEKPGEVGKDGRAEFTKAQAEQKKHDPVAVKSVTVGTDDRTVFLEIPDLRPAMQMQIAYDLKTSDGQDLRGEVVHTIHGFGEEAR